MAVMESSNYDRIATDYYIAARFSVFGMFFPVAETFFIMLLKCILKRL
jgi:hypothetical protein